MEFPDGCVVLEQCGESSESRRLAGSMFEEREVKKRRRGIILAKKLHEQKD